MMIMYFTFIFMIINELLKKVVFRSLTNLMKISGEIRPYKAQVLTEL